MWEGLFGIIRIVTAVITGVIGPILLWWIKERYDDEIPLEEEKERTINEEVEFARDIRNEIKSIQGEIGSDRVWIAQFHNGGRLLNAGYNSSMKKVSITYEVTAKGVSKEKYKINGVLVSFFSELISTIMENDFSAYDCENEEIDPEVQLLLRERGTKKMCIFAMKNIDGTLIGLMGIDFTNNENRNLTEKEIQYLRVKANLLAGYVVHGKVELEE